MTTTIQQEPNVSYKGQKFTIKTSTNQLISVTLVVNLLYYYGQVVQIQERLKAYTFPDGQTIFTLYHPLIKFGKVGEFGGETVTTTLAAQLSTLPILLSVFGQFGLLSILVNALVLWMSPYYGIWQCCGDCRVTGALRRYSYFISGISVSLFLWYQQFGYP